MRSKIHAVRECHCHPLLLPVKPCPAGTMARQQGIHGCNRTASAFTELYIIAEYSSRLVAKRDFTVFQLSPIIEITDSKAKNYSQSLSVNLAK